MKTFFAAFRRGLEKTATRLTRSIGGLFTGVHACGSETFDRLEEELIAADFGVHAAVDIAGTIRDRYDRGLLKTDADIRAVASEEVRSILAESARPLHRAEQGKPTVILFVGVNGSGKTTTIGKLAARLHASGATIMLAACDTFRAAAVEQLKLWGERTDSQVIASKHGADPASVAYDAAAAALARGVDYLLIDTAGRQQNQQNLMQELAKVRRSIEKVFPGAPHEVFLTVDASLGGNALQQAKGFSEHCGVTALVLTKLDGTGRGGMVVALQKEFHLPVFFAGFGEQPEDLQEFDPVYYSAALFGLEADRGSRAEN